ncbi:MAG: hypothetical protein JSS74_09050 [Actinobacteria bacterium]|nr:hypothetical protein [Actinomycetota bacterium]
MSTRYPVVRNPQGAILGTDWRRVPGMGLVSVPGRIPTHDVQPGDTVRLAEQDVVVHKVIGSRSAAVLHLVTRSAGGAELIHEAVIGEEIDVVAVGAFEPGAGS